MLWNAFQLNKDLNWKQQHYENKLLYRSLLTKSFFKRKACVVVFGSTCPEGEGEGILGSVDGRALALYRPPCFSCTLSTAFVLLPCFPGAIGLFQVLLGLHGLLAKGCPLLVWFRKSSESIISLCLWKLMKKNTLGLGLLRMKATVGYLAVEMSVE